MALNQRNSTRWMARVGTWVLETGVLVLTALKAFLDFQEEDGLIEKGEKVASLAVRRLAYLFADYGLWVVSVAIFTTMKFYGFSFLVIFAAIWVFEFAAAGAFILVYEKMGIDLSLGEDFRRAKDAVSQQSRVAGVLVLVAVVALAIVWTGPEKVILFFRKELRTVTRVLAATVTLTIIQAFVWTVLYDLGYGLVVEFF